MKPSRSSKPKLRPHLDKDTPQQTKAGRISPALVLSVVALLVSILSTYLSWFSGRDTAKSQAIREAYGTFLELNRLQLSNWQQSHLFAMPEHYQHVRAQVVASIEPVSEQQRMELLLKERAIADFIFTLYEENRYLRQQAEVAGDQARARFLSEVENYLIGRALRNPRLLYYWSPEGAGLFASFEVATQEHYKNNVLLDPKSPLQYMPDPHGPFGPQ